MFTVNPQPKLDCEDCSYYSTVELLNNNNSYEFAERKKKLWKTSVLLRMNGG